MIVTLKRIEPMLPNQEMLAIVRLHLERLPIMSPEERACFLRVTALLMESPMIVNADEGLSDLLRAETARREPPP